MSEPPQKYVSVKLEPASENEFYEEEDNQLSHHKEEEEEEVVIRRRSSQRAVVVNVKRENYREIETDTDDEESQGREADDDDDYYQHQPKKNAVPKTNSISTCQKRKRGRPAGAKNRSKSKENEGDKGEVEREEKEKRQVRKAPKKGVKMEVDSDPDEQYNSSSSSSTRKRGDWKSLSREEDRIRKQLKRAQMSLAEREEYLKKQRERKQARRSQMTDKEREEQRRRERERKALKRQLKTPEQKREESQRETIRRLVQHSNMSPEQMAEYKQKRYFQYLTQKAKKSEEELELKRRLHTEKQKLKRQSLTGQERQKFLDQLKNSYRKRIERLKKDPNKWEEAQRKWKEYRIKRKERNKANRETSQGQVKKRSKEKEGEDQGGERSGNKSKPRKKTCPGIKLATPGETEEEKQRRLLENKRLRIQRCNIRRRLAYQKLLDSGMTMDEIRRQKETSEQRERRLITNRINFAKRSIRKRLSQRGAPPEEIEAKIQEFVATYEPHRDFKPYVPRPANHRPINPEDLALLLQGKSKITMATEEEATSNTRGFRKNSTFSGIAAATWSPAYLSSSSFSSPITSSLAFPSTSTAAILGQARLPPPPSTSPAEPFSPSSIAINMSISNSNTNINFPSQIQIPSPSVSSTISDAHSCLCGSEQEENHQEFVTNLSSQDIDFNHYETPSPQYQPHTQSYSQSHPQNSSQNFHHPQHQQGSFSLFDDINAFDVKSSHSAYHQDDFSSSTASYDPPPVSSSSFITEFHHLDDNPSPDKEIHPHCMPPPPPLHEIPRGRGGRGRPRGSKTNSRSTKPQNKSGGKKSERKSTTSSRGGRRAGAGRPKKGEAREPRPTSLPKLNPNQPKRIPGMPRGVYEGKDPKVKRDQVCEMCGNSYSVRYIGDHRTMFHNPNFDYSSGKCLICGESFSSGQKFYKHFIKEHKPGKDSDGKERNHICVSCGEAFVSSEGLQRHEYYQHGDGTKKENFVSCPHCQKEFKQRITLNNHIRVVHSSLGLNLYGCLRCDQKFGLTKELKEHVRVAHPESYFPCEDCNMLKYTKGSLLMHQNYCVKRPTEKKREGRRKEEKYVGIERFPVNCEICQKQIALYSITRHYKDTHGVVDEVFKCGSGNCGKSFKRREWWVAHMETVHSILPEDVKEEIGKYNVEDRSKVVITNYGQKRSYSNKGKKVKGGRKSGGGGRGKNKGRQKKKKVVVSSSSEEEEAEEEKQEQKLDPVAITQPLTLEAVSPFLPNGEVDEGVVKMELPDSESCGSENNEEGLLTLPFDIEKEEMMSNASESE
ncbi:unnamed protein product [Orchesella dallaii]|uniref:C2H2-type domain-containing protein n=1 Tax=Orchesella dallaii TaxID=48710 RepID=A0ABP1RVH4_9HEXA